MEMLKKVTVWYSIQNCGDGSAALLWFLTEREAEIDQEHMYEGWAEECLGSVETYVGSDIHELAIIGSREQLEDDVENENLYGDDGDVEWEDQ